MPDNKKKKIKKYEPPKVKEIGGVYEQAMGASNCSAGGFFSSNPCAGGGTPSGSCSFGSMDQGCWRGASDTAGCSRGIGG